MGKETVMILCILLAGCTTTNINITSQESGGSQSVEIQIEDTKPVRVNLDDTLKKG